MKKILLMFCVLATLSATAQTNTFDDSKVNGAVGAGANDDTWETATNWSLGIIPTAAHDVVIADGKLAKIKVSGAVANTLTAIANGKVQINAQKDLTVTGNITAGTKSNILFVTAAGKNMGTLIFGGTYTGGNISAKVRLPNNNKWHLISTPYKQVTIATYISNATTIATGDSDGNGINSDGGGDKYSLATYNDGNASGSKYSYYPNPLLGTEGNLEKGQGYSTLVNNISDTSKPDIQFKGKPNDADVFSPTLVYAGSGFVLLGNPFTAYVYANENADATKNLLTVNSGKLEQETIWLWDGTNSAWVTKNQSDAAFHIAPGQGYFVKVKSTVSGKFRTNEDMQTHVRTGSMLKTSSIRFEINLSMKAGKSTKRTAIRFIDNTTTSFDNGYDSSLFSGYSSGTEIYTELVENNSGKKLAIQSLPNSNFENMVVPVGVNAAAGSEIVFSTETLNIPSGYKVFLEDRTNNVFTRLDEANTEYKTTVSKSSTDGRFFLHTKTSSVLNIDSELLSGVSIYKTTNSNLRVSGLQKGKTTISLYNLIGKQVMTSSFEGANVNNVSLPSLAKGVYIVKLKTTTGKLNKKIIIE